MKPESRSTGITMSDVLSLTDSERGLLVWVLRHRSVDREELMAKLSSEGTRSEVIVANLEERGFLKRSDRCGEARYHVAIALRSKRSLAAGFWEALHPSDAPEPGKGEADTQVEDGEARPDVSP